MTTFSCRMRRVLAAPTEPADRWVPLGIALGIVAFHFVANRGGGASVLQGVAGALGFGVLACSLLLGLPMVGLSGGGRRRAALLACGGTLAAGLLLLGYVVPFVARQGYYGPGDGGPEYWSAHQFLMVAVAGRSPTAAVVQPAVQLYSSIAAWRSAAQCLFVVAAFAPAMAPWRIRVPWWLTTLTGVVVVSANRWALGPIVADLAMGEIGHQAFLLLLAAPQVACAALVMLAARRYGRPVTV